MAKIIEISKVWSTEESDIGDKPVEIDLTSDLSNESSSRTRQSGRDVHNRNVLNMRVEPGETELSKRLNEVSSNLMKVKWLRENIRNGLFPPKHILEDFKNQSWYKDYFLKEYSAEIKNPPRGHWSGFQNLDVFRSYDLSYVPHFIFEDKGKLIVFRLKSLSAADQHLFLQFKVCLENQPCECLEYFLENQLQEYLSATEPPNRRTTVMFCLPRNVAPSFSYISLAAYQNLSNNNCIFRRVPRLDFSRSLSNFKLFSFGAMNQSCEGSNLTMDQKAVYQIGRSVGHFFDTLKLYPIPTARKSLMEFMTMGTFHNCDKLLQLDPAMVTIENPTTSAVVVDTPKYAPSLIGDCQRTYGSRKILPKGQVQVATVQPIVRNVVSDSRRSPETSFQPPPALKQVVEITNKDTGSRDDASTKGKDADRSRPYGTIRVAKNLLDPSVVKTSSEEVTKPTHPPLYKNLPFDSSATKPIVIQSPLQALTSAKQPSKSIAHFQSQPERPMATIKVLNPSQYQSSGVAKTTPTVISQPRTVSDQKGVRWLLVAGKLVPVDGLKNTLPAQLSSTPATVCVLGTPVADLPNLSIDPVQDIVLSSSPKPPDAIRPIRTSSPSVGSAMSVPVVLQQDSRAQSTSKPTGSSLFIPRSTVVPVKNVECVARILTTAVTDPKAQPLRTILVPSAGQGSSGLYKSVLKETVRARTEPKSSDKVVIERRVHLPNRVYGRSNSGGRKSESEIVILDDEDIAEIVDCEPTKKSSVPGKMKEGDIEFVATEEADSIPVLHLAEPDVDVESRSLLAAVTAAGQAKENPEPPSSDTLGSPKKQPPLVLRLFSSFSDKAKPAGPDHQEDPLIDLGSIKAEIEDEMSVLDPLDPEKLLAVKKEKVDESASVVCQPATTIPSLAVKIKLEKDAEDSENHVVDPISEDPRKLTPMLLEPEIEVKEDEIDPPLLLREDPIRNATCETLESQPPKLRIMSVSVEDPLEPSVSEVYRSDTPPKLKIAKVAEQPLSDKTRKVIKVLSSKQTHIFHGRSQKKTNAPLKMLRAMVVIERLDESIVELAQKGQYIHKESGACSLRIMSKPAPCDSRSGVKRRLTADECLVIENEMTLQRPLRSNTVVKTYSKRDPPKSSKKKYDRTYVPPIKKPFVAKIMIQSPPKSEKIKGDKKDERKSILCSDVPLIRGREAVLASSHPHVNKEKPTLSFSLLPDSLFPESSARVSSESQEAD